jgi:hypothetical protein
MALNAQTYIEQWKEVKNLERSQLPKSALKKVELIYKMAKSENDENQIIKALLHKSKYLSTLKEDGLISSIENIKREIGKTQKETTKLILTSILAEMYSTYLDRHRYQTRSHIDSKKGIRSWSNEKLSNKISQLYIDSIGDEAKFVKIEDYRTILTNDDENSEGLRPTLYDFLAFRALEHFNNYRSYLHKPIYDFYIKDKEAFGSIQTFLDYEFQTPNQNSFKYKALLIYQNLLQFHKDRRDQKAMAHINFERIKFVYRNFIGDAKEQYFIDALNSLESQHIHSESLYYLAKYYYKKNDYHKAMSYAKRGIESGDAYLSKMCLYVKKDIEWQSINLDIEKVNLPNENILAKLSYRNINRIFVKVIKVKEKDHKKLNSIDYDKRDDYIKELESFSEFNLSLPLKNDYKRHYTEISLGSYQCGHYIFLVSKDRSFSKFSKSFLAISKIAYFHKNSKLLVVDRESGEPLKGVEAKLYLSKYNNRTGESRREFISKKTSDKDGIIFLPRSEHQYAIHLKYKEDSINFATGSSYESDDYNYLDKRRETLHIFTDRAIYRPSQTIYFKGLATEQNRKIGSKILTNKEIEVSLYNSNRKKIESKWFTTNEFGTINGSFTLPKSGRLGSFYISSNIGGRNSIRVEEYKRPKFEISFDTLDKSYRLGDKVKIKGIAKAYAGNGINGATIKYMIRRRVSFPWRGWGCDIIHPNSIESQIAMGELKTDKSGKFKISFNALVDESIPSQSQPSFSYIISVDITDTTGETQSANKTINLGSVTVNANMIIDDTINMDSNRSLKLETTNLNGNFEPLKGKIVIEKFKKMKRVYRKRYWSISDIDTFIYSKKKFQNLFKNYKYIKREKIDKTVIETLKFDTKKSKFLAFGKLEQGEYLLTLYAKDRYGTEVKKSKKITIYDINASSPPYQTNLWDRTDKDKYAIGSTATIHIKSSSPNSYAFLTIEKNQKIFKQKWIKIDNLTKELVKIEKKDRGDIFYYLNMIKNNREYGSFKRIKVPWNKKLKIEYRSFRDKLKPNEKEQWSIKISGEGKDKIVAEMVATMYDASLDKFVKHNFHISNLFPHNLNNYKNRWSAKDFSLVNSFMEWGYERYSGKNPKRVFPHLNMFGSSSSRRNRGYSMEHSAQMVQVEAMPVAVGEPTIVYASAQRDVFEEESGELGGDIGGVISFEDSKPVAIRKNLKETMFFKPNLKTDEDGNIIIEFKTNEALTRWNFLAFVHTKDLKTAVTQKEIVTQKELMVVTNLPRFFREDDSIILSAKVVNMSSKDLTGVCQLHLTNPANQTNIYGDHNFSKTIFLKKGGSKEINFRIRVPKVDSVSTIQHTIIAKTDKYSDAEQIIRPILSNREFITESRLLPLKAKETKSFTLNSLKNNNSNTLKNHKLILEFTSNPIWYVIKSLPYLMEYPHECSEQLFNRYYANIIASKIVNSLPKIKKIFESWKSKGGLKSALSTNEELKSILLEETPWVLNAESEEKKQKNIGILFDLVKLEQSEKNAYDKLIERQNRDGSWSWFSGGNPSWYITQYIIEGFAKLKKMGINIEKPYREGGTMDIAVKFIEKNMLRDYQLLQKSVEKGYTTDEIDHLNSRLIHYLYTRTFYNFTMSYKVQQAHNYYLSQAKKYWTKKGLYEQGMIALTLYRVGFQKEAENIVHSLKERALIDDELGMYFKYKNGFYWNELPIETHTLMIDVFNTIANDKESVELLKTWLLKSRQTIHWKTTKATSSAIYALLMDNSWLSNEKLVDISFDTKIAYQPILEKAKTSAESGSGYFKASFDKFDNDMATLKVTNPNSHIAWGGLYWQYFEDLDKIKAFKETPLTIDKKLFLVKQTQSGEKLISAENLTLKVGDKIKVRIEIKVDRGMEYLMIKDSRASTFEPINVLSQYRWQDGLGYYESTKDNATYLFIDSIRRGTYVFEYPLFVTHRGNFSNAIATIESMYAPEFKSHSKGGRINVK